MFRDIFKDLEASVPGLLAISAVGRDGIEIQCQVREDLPHEVISAEMNGLLMNLERLEQEFEIGKTSELIIRTNIQNIMMVTVSSELFVLAITSPTTPTGLARYHIQRNAHRFVEALT